MKRKIIVSIVGCMFLAMLGGCRSEAPAHADSSTGGSEMNSEAPLPDADMSDEPLQPAFSFETGVVNFVDSENNQITLTSGKTADLTAPENTVTLNIGDETYFIESGEVKLTDMASVKEGDEIFAWVSPAYTASLPPQTAARVVLTNLGNSDIPTLVKVESVEIQDDKIVLNDADGTVWSFDKEISPVMISNNEAIAFDKIEQGSDCLIWPKIMPADTEAGGNVLAGERIVVLK